jgi:hypothetical protein
MQTAGHIVVFDNNAYGDMLSSRLQGDLNECLRGLTADEARAGVEARACPTVMAELIASWADSSSPAHAPSVASIKALVRHCTGRSGALAMIADEQSIACNAIFGTVPPLLDGNNRRLAGLCRSIAAGRTLTPPEMENVKALRARVEAQERGFVDSMKQVQRDLGGYDYNQAERKKAFDDYTKSSEWSLAYGQMALDRCIDASGQSVDAARRDEAVKALLGMSKASLALWTEFFENLLVNGAKPDRRKRENLIWDCQILAAAENLLVDGVPILLVTSDRAMIRAAGSAQRAHACMSYGDYRDWLLRRMAAEQQHAVDGASHRS